MVDPHHVPLRRHGLGHLETYDVTADELVALEREGGNVGLDFQFALFFLTEATSFLIALATTTPDRPWIADTGRVLVVVGFLLGVVFGIRWLRGRSAFAQTIARIRERPIGPIGTEGHEIAKADLEKLSPVDPAGAKAVAGKS